MSDELRSRTWLGDGGKNGFIARHHLRALGLGTPQLSGKPLIGIANTWSELTPPPATRGWTRLYVDHVTQADTCVDLDFLVGGSGDSPARAPF
jgi:dihydroxyacid dehydratase/phosphogluconate dehydratase